MTECFTTDILSKRKAILDEIENRVLVRMVRFSWFSAEKSATECEIECSEVFSLTAGPVLLYFDSGLVIGAGSRPSENTVHIWVERNEVGNIAKDRDEPLELDKELFPIEATDQKYSNFFWSQIIGKKIVKTTILKEKPRTVLYENLPNEVGLLITMETGDEFILSHGLHDESDDFSVIQKSQIDRKLLKGIEGI
jgi:hypothetical protein